MTARSLYSLADLPRDTVQRLVQRSCELYDDPKHHDRPLTDRVVGVLFSRTSTRTRTAFTAGTIRLGGTPIGYGPGELQTATGESLADTGRMFAGMLDALVVRTAGPVAEMRLLSDDGRLPVINAMAAEEHPTQGLSDLATLVARFGDLSGLHVLYVGEGNNTATALAHALGPVAGCRVTFACPKGYGLPSSVLDHAPGTVQQVHDLSEVIGDVHVVYTTRWQTTGTAKQDADWREIFRPFHVDEALMKRWPEAVFMHDLPAHRGEEVAGAVLDGDRSIAWDQARMKAAGAMAVLEWAAGPEPVRRDDRGSGR